MSGALRLAWAHARRHAARTLLLVLCVFVSGAIPLAMRVLAGAFEAGLLARARATPLVAGVPGSRVDLVMTTLYFRPASGATVSMADWEELAREGEVAAIPMNTRYTARGLPLVATSVDYFALRGLVAARGTLPARAGEVVLGAAAARRLGLGAGDALFSDQRDVLDITRPAAVKMRVVGVLKPAGSADDGAVFTDLATAWVLEGLMHAHADAATKVPEALVLNRSETNVTVSEELVDYNELTPERLATLHLHAEPARLPLTAVIIAPRTAKAGAMLRSRVNAGSRLRVVSPEEAVAEMLRYVARLGRVVDGLSVVAGGLTLVLLGLVTALSAKVRSREVETLSRIGASRATIASIFAWELAVVIGAGWAVALVTTTVLRAFPPDLVKLL